MHIDNPWKKIDQITIYDNVDEQMQHMIEMQHRAAEDEFNVIIEVLSREPEWFVTSAQIVTLDNSTWVLSIMVRHRSEELMTLVRSLGEWREVKRRHVCPEE